MKIFYWIYVILFIIITPLFIYDMYVEGNVNFAFVAGFILIFILYKQTFKQENRDE